MNNQIVCGKEPEASVATEVLTLLVQVSEMSVGTSDALCKILEPIMRKSSPNEDVYVPDPHREYPPLFKDLYTNICSIKASSIIIEDAIHRTELPQ